MFCLKYRNSFGFRSERPITLSPIVTVPFFRDVVMPRYKRIRKKLESYGIDLWYVDCDGDMRPILPYMMEGGINCLFPFEVNSCAHPS